MEKTSVQKPFRIYRFEFGTLRNCFGEFESLEEALRDFKLKLLFGQVNKDSQFIFVYHKATTLSESRIIGYADVNGNYIKIE